MTKSLWLASAGIAALTAAPAFAQDTVQKDPTTQTSPTEATSTAPAPAADTGEIIVTAQGRRQALQNVPIAVTAVSGDALKNSGATDIRSLNQLAPSLLVSSTGTEANGSARIRGVGTVGDNPGLESSVAVFIDGVYRSRSGIGLSELGELDRIEVLRGPQGTLFGRNASAGLISVFSKKPSFTFGGSGEATIGNYNLRRFTAGLTGPITDSLAFRLDGVYVKRDGFYHDRNNGTDVNDRNRYFVRGQLLYQPDSQFSIRLIGDYTHRVEKCCGAVYINNEVNSNIGGLNDPAQNPIVGVIRDLGQDLSAFNNPYSRNISVTRGRSFRAKTTDGGVSGEIGYDFGGAKLTSITAYRSYKANQQGDGDYSTVDILYRPSNPKSFRQFKTFTQELRLQGSAFNKKLDWLVGGYYANENLTLQDELRFGNQYGRFAACRLVSGSGLAPLYNPAAAGCLAARPAAFGAASPIIYAAIDRLDGISDRGSTGDLFKQNSRNFAVFTHNIFHITDRLDATIGVRYTNERKKLDASFGNDNVACAQNQAALTPFLANPASPLFVPAISIIRLSCFANISSEFNGVKINGKRKEHRFTGTGVLSYKPTDHLLLYGSASSGYKAGGFNLDKSALKNPEQTLASLGGAQAVASRLQFDPETVRAYEVGGKFTARGVTFNVALFRQDFKNFQLNTFDGTVFVVQNVNSCKTDLAGADRDLSGATGACNKDDVQYGVRSQGVEFETSYRPARDLNLTAGLTLAKTKYRNNLIGRDTGSPLVPALRVLPGQQLSNAPRTVATGSIGYTPRIGGSGLSALFYVDARYSGHYNTGSDLFPQKGQEGYTLVNGRVGVRGPDNRWSVEVWAQNLFNKNYAQVAFNSPFQAGATSAPFVDPAYPGGRQIFSAFLAEPRTFGLTLRASFAAPKAAPVLPPPPPPPPPPAPATQTCADGTVIAVDAACPVAPPPPPPPPPPPSQGERG